MIQPLRAFPYPSYAARSSRRGGYASGTKRRPPADVYFDTLMWIADGRRSWNRKQPKPRTESKLTALHVRKNRSSTLRDRRSTHPR